MFLYLLIWRKYPRIGSKSQRELDCWNAIVLRRYLKSISTTRNRAKRVRSGQLLTIATMRRCKLNYMNEPILNSDYDRIWFTATWRQSLIASLSSSAPSSEMRTMSSLARYSCRNWEKDVVHRTQRHKCSSRIASHPLNWQTPMPEWVITLDMLHSVGISLNLTQTFPCFLVIEWRTT